MAVAAIEAILEECGIAGPVVSRPSGSSSFHSTYEVQADGERFFLKHNFEAWTGHFEAEARGLQALAAATKTLVVPRVIGFADAHRELGSFLLLEFLELGPRGKNWAAELGRGLAELHEPGQRRSYGFEVDGYCGSTPQPNPHCENWIEFYGQHRLAQLGRRAAVRGLEPKTLARVERLVERLPEWIAEEEGPALIHGDLWSGNVLSTAEGRPALIDPAAYYGEREAELGMMSLFGSFPSEVWQAYQQVLPLRKGWRHRLGIYELYHLLNHFVIFGGGYAADVDRTLRQFVG